MIVLPTEESLLGILSEVQESMQKYFHHNCTYNSKNSEVVSVGLDVVGRGYKGGIHM
jgi:hypothetical protein